MKICVFTLGCKVNSSESDSLVRGLKESGYEVCEQLEPADVYIVNTCAVTAEAEKFCSPVSLPSKPLHATIPQPRNFSSKTI